MNKHKKMNKKLWKSASEMCHHAQDSLKKNPQATEKEICQEKIELNSLEKEKKGIENNSGREYAMKIYKVLKNVHIFQGLIMSIFF